MKYCLECDAEYRDEIETCADCLVPLVSEEVYRRAQEEKQEQQEALRSEAFVPVLVANNPFEADRAREALEQEGIPVLVRTFEDTAYDGIYVAQKGWGHVEVPSSKKTLAQRILEELEKVFETQGADSDLVMVCWACGKEIEQDKDVCPHCGESLDKPREP